MKFGKQLELYAFPEWRQYYMSYKKLKRILKRLPDRDGAPSDDEGGAAAIGAAPAEEPLLDHQAASVVDGEAVVADFFKLLEEDVERINAFSAKQLKAIEERAQLLVEGSTSKPVVTGTPFLRHHVIVSDKAAPDMAELTLVYCDCARLRSFAVLNHDGIRKIVKKLEKSLGDKSREQAGGGLEKAWLRRLSSEAFASEHARANRATVTSLEALCTPEQVLTLRRQAQSAAKPRDRTSVGPRPMIAMCIAATLACTVALVPLSAPDVLTKIGHEHRCLAVLTAVVILWLTEALPYFVTSLLVPVLVVFAKVIPHELVPATRPDGVVTRADTARFVLNCMFDKTIVLVLSGLVAASVVARCQIELRLATSLQRSLGTRPRLFLLALMQLGLLTSMCISNVTAPILLLSVVQPVLHELPSGCQYARALLLGLAFSCNLGGMLTPIASPQNAVALEALGHVASSEISFGQWLALALPLAQLGTLACWLLLVLALLSPCDVAALPPIPFDHREALTGAQKAMLAVVVATVGLWASISVPAVGEVLGDPAIAGLLLITCAFGSGFLSKTDFNGLSWHLLALIAGGNALGLAVRSSGLLKLAADLLMKHVLTSSSAWVVTFELSLALLLVTSFISHTVASIVVMPLVASVGASVGEPRAVVFCCALSISAAMALPMSSFPNVNSLLAEDDYGMPYLSPKDFVRLGLPASILVGALVATLGFPSAMLLLP